MNISLYPFAERLRIRPRETGLVVPSRASLLILHTQGESGTFSRDSSRISTAAPIHLFVPLTAIGSLPSLSGHAIAYRWRSLPRVRQKRASKTLKLVPVTGATFSGFSMDQSMYASLFPHTHY